MTDGFLARENNGPIGSLHADTKLDDEWKVLRIKPKHRTSRHHFIDGDRVNGKIAACPPLALTLFMVDLSFLLLCALMIRTKGKE